MVTLSDEKILVTGVTGQIAFPMARLLAQDNRVLGVARYTDPDSRGRVEAAGIEPVVCDLATGDLDVIPDDVTILIHLAAFQGPGLDYDLALTQNADATGFVMQRCARARAALVMSTHSIYKPNPDPTHVYVESDPLGDVNPQHCPTYSISKIGQEAVARFSAKAFGLPTTLARMNASYGPNGGLPALHADAMAAGLPVTTRWDPCWYSAIYEDDINEQVAALLDAASTPATIVNWAGDEPVTVQDWTAEIGRLLGITPEVVVTPIEGSLRGSIASNAKRLAITGPCRTTWREGIRRTVEARYPDRPATA